MLITAVYAVKIFKIRLKASIQSSIGTSFGHFLPCTSCLVGDRIAEISLRINAEDP